MSVVGIDVAKDTLVVATEPTAELWSVANDEVGVQAQGVPDGCNSGSLGSWAGTLSGTGR